MSGVQRAFDEKRGWVWPFAIAVLLNLGLYVLVVRPLSLKVAGGEQQAAGSTAALNAARRDHSAARATVAGKSQADAELGKFYSDVLPPDISGARRITFLRIEQLASKSGLRLERETSDPKPQRDSSLVKFTYTAVLSGDYANVRRFIHDLETAPEFLVLEHVELSQAGAQNPGLTLTVQIATYYRTGSNGN